MGLTFEQFCRTTMLAQGDFTKFLQSKESEKSDILEKLTGTSIYSEIGAEIYAATKERRTEYALHVDRRENNGGGQRTERRSRGESERQAAHAVAGAAG